MYASRSNAKADLFDYIEVFYNRTRLHSHLGHVPPDEYKSPSSNTRAFYLFKI
ncbi:IS3 family transposase [Paraglaciecola algarum]|uniref:IS3 family transposase n=1 Tax=Paraglaciecola algarum TaxID=3050085 RepID=UPI0032E9F02C